MTEQITLYGETADWFRQVKMSMAEDRNGVPPSNAETVRRLMEESKHCSQASVPG